MKLRWTRHPMSIVMVSFAIIAGCAPGIPGIPRPPLPPDSDLMRLPKFIIVDAKKAIADTPAEEEYYIGKAVAAQALATTRGDLKRLRDKLKVAQEANRDSTANGQEVLAVVDVFAHDEQANRYLNLIGQNLALQSARPALYESYSFQILDIDEVSAMSSPGGHILVSRGMLQVCSSEDEVAAVLAHEIAHVALRHGVRAISMQNRIGFAKDLVKTAVTEFGGASAKDLAGNLDGIVGDVTKSLVTRGYSHDFEYEADAAAIEMLERTGYDPRALHSMLLSLERSPLPGRFGTTHPKPADRAEKVLALLEKTPPRAASNPRQARFEAVRGRF